jgi:TatD DNase family protein
MHLVDSHCHLDYYKEQEGGIDAVLDRARLNGVVLFQTIGTNLDQSQEIMKISEKHRDVFSSVGVHPTECATLKNLSLEEIQSRIEKLASSPKVIGLGETGLDYFHDASFVELQKRSFLAHILACKNTSLPLIIHSRDAEEDTLRILNSEEAKGAQGVIHCFTGSEYMAKVCINLGYYVSFSGIITFNNASSLQRIAQMVPLERILIETDAPYLAPVPKRGTRNEPGFVIYVAEKLAEIHGKSFKEIVDITSENFFRLFSKAPRFDQIQETKNTNKTFSILG